MKKNKSTFWRRLLNSVLGSAMFISWVGLPFWAAYSATHLS